MNKVVLPPGEIMGTYNGQPLIRYTAENLHAHAAAVTAAKDAEIAALRAEYERACKLVADMHAAAMGAKVGPLLDVVGDVAAVAHKNTALQERIKVLEEALRGVMSGCKYSCIAGEWHWHEKSIASNAALDAARAALGDKT